MNDIELLQFFGELNICLVREDLGWRRVIALCLPKNESLHCYVHRNHVLWNMCLIDKLYNFYYIQNFTLKFI